MGRSRRATTSLFNDPRFDSARHPREAARIGNVLVASYLAEPTYTDFRRPLLYFLVIVGLFVAPFGLYAGLTFRAYTVAFGKSSSFKISPKEPCWSLANSCEHSPLHQSMYFWNITNPNEFLNGSQPIIKEVGPYYMKKYDVYLNSTFVDGEVLDVVRKQFGDYVAEGSCAECTLDAVIYTMSASYFSILQPFGFSEPKFWLQALTQPVFLNLLGALQSTLAAMAADPAARASFAGLRANITIASALTQWSSCGITSGLSILQLGSAAINSGFPYQVEYCGWARSIGANADASLPATVAQDLYSILTTNGQFIAQMSTFSPSAVAQLFSISTQKAALLQGYFQHLSLTYCRMYWNRAAGPVLGQNSSGPILRRTAGQLLFSNREPIEDFLTPRAPGLRFWEPDAADKSIFLSGAEIPKWKALYASVQNGTLPPSTLANSLAQRRVQSLDKVHYTENYGRFKLYDGVTELPQARGKLRLADQRVYNFQNEKFPFQIDDSTVFRVFMGPKEFNANSKAPFGLGRNINFTWDGSATVMARSLNGKRFVPVPSIGCPRNPDACFYDDYYDGVWNMSHFGVALVITEPHFARSDPAFVASLGNATQSAFDPENNGNWVYLDTVVGIPMIVHVGVQSVVKAAPTALYPNLWNGNPGPQGLIYVPTTYGVQDNGILDPTRVNATDRLYVVQRSVIQLTATPRYYAGFCHVVGSIIAGAAAFFLYFDFHEAKVFREKKAMEREIQGLAPLPGIDPVNSAAIAAACKTTDTPDEEADKAVYEKKTGWGWNWARRTAPEDANGASEEVAASPTASGGEDWAEKAPQPLLPGGLLGTPRRPQTPPSKVYETEVSAPDEEYYERTPAAAARGKRNKVDGTAGREAAAAAAGTPAPGGRVFSRMMNSASLLSGLAEAAEAAAGAEEGRGTPPRPPVDPSVTPRTCSPFSPLTRGGASSGKIFPM